MTSDETTRNLQATRLTHPFRPSALPRYKHTSPMTGMLHRVFREFVWEAACPPWQNPSDARPAASRTTPTRTTKRATALAATPAARAPKQTLRQRRRARRRRAPTRTSRRRHPAPCLTPWSRRLPGRLHGSAASVSTTRRLLATPSRSCARPAMRRRAAAGTWAVCAARKSAARHGARRWSRTRGGRRRRPRPGHKPLQRCRRPQTSHCLTDAGFCVAM